MKRIALTLILLLMPSMASAYSLTCGDARIAVNSGLDFAEGIVVGHLNGAGDVLAGLYCLVGSPRCACLSGLLDNDNFPRRYGQLLNACPANEPAYGPALQAAAQTCP
jgi:hypothetical protein